MQKTTLLVFSTIIVAISAAVLMIAGVLLFTRESYVDYHIQAGNLEVSIEQIKAEGQIDRTDYSGKNAYNQIIDLTQEGSKIFDIKNVCPLDWHEASLKITNTGNIDITYSVSIVNLEATTVQSVALLSQVKIYLYHNDGTELESFYLIDVFNSSERERVLKIGTDRVLSYKNGDSDTFKLKALFEDNEDNNLAMGGRISFDIRFDVVQAEIYE